MENKNFTINGQEIKVSVFDKESVKVGSYEFENKEDFIYFVNKLTDIAEEILEDK